MNRVLILVWIALLPQMADAQSAVTRQAGFLRIWETIHRPAERMTESAFRDLTPDDPSFLSASYARHRGILDDTDSFDPHAPLLLDDALVWLFRTRNVTVWNAMEKHHLPDLLVRYPVVGPHRLKKGDVVSGEDLESLITSLDRQLREEVHEVSLYAEKFHGKGTAFGESFDMYALTAAHRTLPHNTLVKVTNTDNGRSVIVRINDRGPFVEGRDMDLSLAAFTTIAERSRGVIRATFERLGDVALVSASLHRQESPTSAPNGAPTDSTAITLVNEAMATDQDYEIALKRARMRLRQRMGSDAHTPSERDEAQCGTLPATYQTKIAGQTRLIRGVPHRFVTGRTLVLNGNRAFVVHQVIEPDGTSTSRAVWIDPGHRFAFNVLQPGRYRFIIGSADGRRREFFMTAEECRK